jgi:hypothetical protein
MASTNKLLAPRVTSYTSPPESDSKQFLLG